MRMMSNPTVPLTLQVWVVSNSTASIVRSNFNSTAPLTWAQGCEGEIQLYSDVDSGVTSRGTSNPTVPLTLGRVRVTYDIEPKGPSAVENIGDSEPNCAIECVSG